MEWAEEITRIGGTDVPDDLFHRVQAYFPNGQIAYLTAAVVEINGWNRLVKAMKFGEVGSYQPVQFHTAATSH